MGEKESHKRMIIGNKGEKLKAIASGARLDIEKLIDKKSVSPVLVQSKISWSEDEGALRQLGYD